MARLGRLGALASAVWIPVCASSLVLARPFPSPAGAPAPELALQREFTFTGEVRAILLVNDEVWAATGGGLAIHRRSDGAHLRTMTSGDGLPGNSLRSLARADGRYVVVGTDFGTAMVDLKRLAAGKTDAIAKLDCDLGCLRFDPVYAILSDASGLWLLRHQSGLQRWERKSSGSWARVTTATAGGSGVWHALAQGPVLGGLDGRLLFQDESGKAGVHFALTSPVLALQARQKDVVAATGEKLLQVRPDGLRTLVIQEAGASRAIAASALSAMDADGMMVVGTAEGEVWTLRQDKLERAIDGLPGRITALATDGPRLWLGVGRAGLHVVSPGLPAVALRPDDELCDNHVVGILQFRDRLVAATFDRGACYLDDTGWHGLAGLPSPMLHGLGSDGQDVYLATSNGIARFDGHMQPRAFGWRDPAVLRWASQSAATAIAPIDSNAIAITSAYGLVQVRRTGKLLQATFISHRAGVPLKSTGVAAGAGEIWVSSETQGVKGLGLGEHQPRHLQDPVDLRENWVTALAAPGPGDLWVGTCQSGVARVGKDGSQFFDKSNLLPDNMVVVMVADQRGAFIGTLGGLAFAASRGFSGKSYGWETSIPDPRSSALLLTDSELWLGTEAGLAQYRLENSRN
jgi:ligand-binding sensor domain-containing protein